VRWGENRRARSPAGFAKLSPMPIKAVVFDLFDTLVDLMTENVPVMQHAGGPVPGFLAQLHAALPEPQGIDFDTFLAAMAEVDRDFRKSHYAHGLEVPTIERFASLVDVLGLSDTSLADVLAAHHMEGLKSHVRNLDHHPRVLAALAERVQVGVCSNFSHASTAQAVLDEAQLTPHLAAIVISEEVGIRKPRPEIFEATLSALGVRAEETLHVGDSLSADVAGASALGIPTAWITRRIKDPAKALADFDGPRPTRQIADLAELVELVASEAPAR
jgi:HAD superfamily hydrolase (TIGR01493 family)